MEKTTVLIDKKSIDGVVGNKSDFVRKAIADKFMHEVSVDSEVNEHKMKLLKLEKKRLKLEISRIKKSMQNIKKFMED